MSDGKSGLMKGLMGLGGAAVPGGMFGMMGGGDGKKDFNPLALLMGLGTGGLMGSRGIGGGNGGPMNMLHILSPFLSSMFGSHSPDTTGTGQ